MSYKKYTLREGYIPCWRWLLPTEVDGRPLHWMLVDWAWACRIGPYTITVSRRDVPPHRVSLHHAAYREIHMEVHTVEDAVITLEDLARWALRGGNMSLPYVVYDTSAIRDALV